MPKLVPISAKKMIKILQGLGFALLRVKGSHHFFAHPDSGRTATVPVHGNEALGIGLLKSILRDIELSVEEYDGLRRKV
mgnify:CR=1 FL=1